MRGFSPDPGHPNPIVTRRQFLLGAATAATALAFYSNEIARHELEVVSRTFFLRNLPESFHGYRIAQISDIHLEEYTEDFFLRRVIDRVNALAPDLVLITGDFVSRGPLPYSVSLAAAERCAELLAALNAPHRFGSMGNHDVVVGTREVRGHLEANGTPILINQYIALERGPHHLFLAGTDDSLASHPNLDQALPANPDAPILLMAHEPDFATHVVTHARGRNVDLMLSGHTHGGQIRLPGLRPLALPPQGRLYPQGHYALGPLQLYVNRGIGTVGIPFRLNCPPEITLATLQPTTEPA